MLLKSPFPFYARALCTYKGATNDSQDRSLGMSPGELIWVTSIGEDNLYWTGVKLNNALLPVGKSGTFLHTYVETVKVGPGTRVIASKSFRNIDKQPSSPSPGQASESKNPPAQATPPITQFASTESTLPNSPGSFDTARLPPSKFLPRLEFEQGQTIYVHDMSNGEEESEGVMMQGQVVDPKTDKAVGPRGWFPYSLTFLPFEVTAILDSWWGPQAYSDLFFTEGHRILVESLEDSGDIEPYRGPRWKGRLGGSGYFPAELVVLSTLYRNGNGLTRSTRLSGGGPPKGRPAYPYRVTSKKDTYGYSEELGQLGHEDSMACNQHQSSMTGELMFPVEHPILVTGQVSSSQFKGRLLCKDTLEPIGEEAVFDRKAVWNDPW